MKNRRGRSQAIHKELGKPQLCISTQSLHPWAPRAPSWHVKHLRSLMPVSMEHEEHPPALHRVFIHHRNTSAWLSDDFLATFWIVPLPNSVLLLVRAWDRCKQAPINPGHLAEVSCWISENKSSLFRETGPSSPVSFHCWVQNRHWVFSHWVPIA